MGIRINTLKSCQLTVSNDNRACVHNYGFLTSYTVPNISLLLGHNHKAIGTTMTFMPLLHQGIYLARLVIILAFRWIKPNDVLPQKPAYILSL